MPCPDCGSLMSKWLKNANTSVRMHFDFHYEGKCNGCGISLWRHGNAQRNRPGQGSAKCSTKRASLIALKLPGYANRQNWRLRPYSSRTARNPAVLISAITNSPKRTASSSVGMPRLIGCRSPPPRRDQSQNLPEDSNPIIPELRDIRRKNPIERHLQPFQISDRPA
jgi:hypothetical protein